MALLLESGLAEATVAIVSLCLLLYWFLVNNFDYWEKRGVPAGKPVPLFGSLRDRLLFRKSLGEAWVKLYRELEGHKLGGAWLVKKPLLFVRDPEIVKRVLVKDFAHFHDRGLTVDERSNPLSANLFNLSGARWRALRAKLTPTFTSGKMRLMFGLMQECAREFANFVEAARADEGALEFKEAFAKFTTDVIGTCAFGLQCNSMRDPDSQFRVMGRKVFTPSIRAILGQMIFHLLPSLGRFLNVRFPERDVSDFFLEVVKDTVEYREKNNIKRNDFLQLLIELKNKGKIEDDDGEKMKESGTGLENGDLKDVVLTDNLMAAQAFVFFLAGFETSSTTMSFALHELVTNLDIQDKLRAEIDDVLQHSGGELSFDAIKKMEYLDRVISESLRKYPPVPVLMRVCTKEYLEPDTGAIIEEDMRVIIPVQALHYDPKFFPNPSVFDPDRFTEGNKAKRPNCVYLPFGEGPRICIGLRFGLLQAKLGLATLLRQFELRPSSRTKSPLELDPKALITSCKGGIWACVQPRQFYPQDSKSPWRGGQ